MFGGWLVTTAPGLTFLAARNEVDALRIGIYGLSWGGAVTLLTAATDQRVQAAVKKWVDFVV